MRRVTRISRGPTAIEGTAGRKYAVDHLWRIEGIEDDLFVASTRHGMTICDYFGRMQNCWHTGISAGDLADLHMRRARGQS